MRSGVYHRSIIGGISYEREMLSGPIPIRYDDAVGPECLSRDDMLSVVNDSKPFTAAQVEHVRECQRCRVTHLAVSARHMRAIVTKEPETEASELETAAS